MKNWIVIFLTALTLCYSSSIVAEECMEGDCDDGFGVGFTDDNKIYEGEWKGGMPHGQGKLFVSKGEVVEGLWEKGELVMEKSKQKENDTKEK